MNFLRAAELKEPVERASGFRTRSASYRSVPPSNPTGSWAGRRYYPCEVLSETPTKYRIRLLAKDGVLLPGKRYAAYGQVVTVPKRAVYDISSQLTRGL
jgi:hypothetical protein